MTQKNEFVLLVCEQVIRLMSNICRDRSEMESVKEASNESTLLRHRQHKQELKLRKRQRIELSGGTRPRPESHVSKKATDETKHLRSSTTSSTSVSFSNVSQDDRRGYSSHIDSLQERQQHHRFGRVMERTPCRNIPRYSTVSIAIPSSILYNCQTRELKTILCGQIARAATIYHVDEIIVYDDGTAMRPKSNGRNQYRQNRDLDGYGKHRRDDFVTGTKHESDTTEADAPKGMEDNLDQTTIEKSVTTATEQTIPTIRSNPLQFMARLLQYCECPQYLRKHFFPIHSDLQFTGLLAPIDAPHHVRAEDRCRFREGVVLQNVDKAGGGSLINCGISKRPVLYVLTFWCSEKHCSCARFGTTDDWVYTR
jgi:predicted SPOUT superfamily RNA methylase MTH1